MLFDQIDDQDIIDEIEEKKKTPLHRKRQDSTHPFQYKSHFETLSGDRVSMDAGSG